MVWIKQCQCKGGEEEEENVFNGVRCDKQPSATNESKLTMMKDSKETMHPGANMQLPLQSISYDGLHCQLEVI